MVSSYIKVLVNDKGHRTLDGKPLSKTTTKSLKHHLLSSRNTTHCDALTEKISSNIYEHLLYGGCP